MRTQVKCKVCDAPLIAKTKHAASSTLLDHIRKEHPETLAWIYQKQDEIGEIRVEVSRRTGYDVLR